MFVIENQKTLGLQLPQDLVNSVLHHRLATLGLLQVEPLLLLALLLHFSHLFLPLCSLSSPFPALSPPVVLHSFTD